MADESVGSVSLELRAETDALLGQVKTIAAEVSNLLGNSVSKSFSVGKSDVDLSGITSILSTISNKMSGSVSDGINKGAERGASEAVKSVSAAISGIKSARIQVSITKEDLTKQLENMVSQLDNTNAKIYVQQQAVAELERQWNNMGRMGTQDTSDGLSIKKKILDTEAAMIRLQGESDQLVTKTNAVEAAISNFSSAAKNDIKQVASAATETKADISSVGAAADKASSKVVGIGTSGQAAGNKASSGLMKVVQSLSGVGRGSGSGIETRLAGIEKTAQKTMRTVTALGRRFLVLFTGKLISGAFNGVSESLDEATESSEELKASMNSLTSAGKTVSNGVIVAIAPLINVVAPTLTSVSDKIRIFSNKVAMFVASILGQKTVLQATASAYEEYGSSVTSASKALAGFDTLNILDSGSASSGSGSSNSDDIFKTVPVSGSVADAAQDFKTSLEPIEQAFSDLWDSISPLKDEAQDFWDNYLSDLAAWSLSDGIPDLIDMLTDFLSYLNDHPKVTAALFGTATGLWATYKALSAIAGIKNLLTILGFLSTSGGSAGVGAGAAAGTGVSLLTLLAAAGITVGTAAYVLDDDGAEYMGETISDALDRVINNPSEATTTDRLITNPLTGIPIVLGDALTYMGAELFGAFDPNRTDDYYQDQRHQGISNIADTINSWSPLDILSSYKGTNTIDSGSLWKSPFELSSTDDVENRFAAINAEISGTRKNWESSLSGMPSDIEEFLRDSGKLVDTGAKNWESSINGMPSALQGALRKNGTLLSTSISDTRNKYAGLASAMSTGMSTAVTKAKDTVTGVLTTWGGMPSGISAILESTNNVISNKSALGSAAISGNTRTGTDGAIGSYSSLRDRASEIFGTITNIITGQSETAKNNLLNLTGASVAGTKEGHRGLINKLNEYFAAMANNSATATKRSFQTLGGMPTSVQKYLGISWTGFKESAAISFPMFANGAYLRANQPQLAIVGDNRYEGEFVAPESKLIEAVTSGVNAALGKINGAAQPTQSNDITIIIGDKQITDYVTERSNRSNRLRNK